jgi:hypothetical protein
MGDVTVQYKSTRELFRFFALAFDSLPCQAAFHLCLNARDLAKTHGSKIPPEDTREMM